MINFRSKLSITSPETMVQWKDVSGNVEELGFYTNAFGRETFSTTDIYEQLNLYIASLNINDQKQLYSLYNQIRYNFDNTISYKELVANLKQIIGEISTHLNIDHVYNWIKNYSNIRIPDGFDTTYEHNINNNKTQEKTYLKEDYIYLMAYCIVLKAFVPIWGEYINLIRKEIGTDFKEYNSFQLLSSTNYVNSKPYQRLLTYIEHIISEDMFNNYNIINNISSEDYNYYIFCLTSVRRLAFIEIKNVGNFTDDDNRLNIVTFVYKFIKQKIKGNVSNPKNIVKDKNTISASIDENSKISVLEKYKIKTDISLEDIVELEHSVSDPYAIAQRLSSNINFSILEESLRTSMMLNHAKIPDTSIRLLQWVMKPVISPRGVLYVSRPVLVKLLGVLEAVLWARGYKYLALLSTSQKIVNEGVINVFSVDSKNKIPPELIQQLEKLYPFIKPAKTTKALKNENRYIINTIDSFSNNMSSHILKMTANEKLIEEVFGSNNRKLNVTQDIKTMLAKLFVELGSRSWT